MIIFHKKTKLKKFLKDNVKNMKIGFIPTMGSIHKGHLSLIQESKKKGYFTCCSIFVNPTQFNNKSDFDSYPKNEKEDINLLKKDGCNLVFIPNIQEIYPNNMKIEKYVKKYRNILCDSFRPNHFDGVATVVSKMLNLFDPDFIFFGEKDYQQLKIISELVNMKKIKTKVIGCPSIRDNNGMSLSSRYRLFNKNQKNKFILVSKIISNFIHVIKKNNKVNEFISIYKKELKKAGVTKIDYFEIRDTNTLNVNTSRLNSRLFVAFYIDKIRIVDNFFI